MAFTSINVFIQITKKKGHWTRSNHWSQNGNSWTLKAMLYVPKWKNIHLQMISSGVSTRSRSGRRCADLAPEARDFFLSEEAKLRFLAAELMDSMVISWDKLGISLDISTTKPNHRTYKLTWLRFGWMHMSFAGNWTSWFLANFPTIQWEKHQGELGLIGSYILV